MAEKNQNTGLGILSIILGVISLFSISFVFIINFNVAVFIAIIALIVGFIAEGRKDKYGKYGVWLGAIAFLLSIIIYVIIYI